MKSLEPQFRVTIELHTSDASQEWLASLRERCGDLGACVVSLTAEGLTESPLPDTPTAEAGIPATLKERPAQIQETAPARTSAPEAPQESTTEDAAELVRLEEVYQGDFLAFDAKFTRNGYRGRPTFHGEVAENEQQCVDYWIACIPTRLEHPGTNLLSAASMFMYLNDLSRNEQRGGGHYGLLGPDPDVRRLHRALLDRLPTFPPPGEGYTDVKMPKGEVVRVSSETYVELFTDLFARTVGLTVLQEFLQAHGDNGGDNISTRNPYLQKSPLERYNLMRAYLAGISPARY